MNPLAWSFRTQMLLGSLTCLALVGFALYTQFQWGFEPCELCVHQRIAWLILAGTSLLAALIAPRRPNARRILASLALLPALAGAFIAGKQIWLKLFPPAMPTCAAPVYIEHPTLWQHIFTPTVECGLLADWVFLGLNMPAWSLLWFLLLGAWILCAGFKAARA